MKTITQSLFLAIFTLLLVSCARKENTPVLPLNEMRLDMSNLKTTGIFADGDGETASGKAAIYQKDKTYQLVFENLMVNNGPNLHVYLSQEIDPKKFVDLGDLKSIKGNQVYDVPANVDATSYKYALVYCQKYKHLFGYALLK
jgi:Electron transfer DM13